LRLLPGKTELLILLAAAWMVATCNAGFWHVLHFGGDAGSALGVPALAAFLMIATGLTSLVLMILATGPVTRPVLALLLAAGAAAGYFTTNYGVMFDKDMLANVVETNVAEASELVSYGLVLTIILFGLLPGLLVMRVPLPKRGFGTAVVQRAAGMVVAIALIAVPLALDQKAVFSTVRNHRELAHMIAPVDVVSATWSYSEDLLDTPPPYRRIGEDARHAANDAANGHPTVHVLIVGETARAANFGINGYGRDTSPGVQQRPTISFKHVESCGTATAQSLPCMFSVQTMTNFDREQSDHQDNLLDVAARAGFDVRWIDNGNSCKGVCSRIANLQLAESDVADLCKSDGCYDEYLVDELARLLPAIDHDTVIVLHQLGSHGPAYYRRYPEDFRRFVPDCRSDDFADCTNEEITNAYDNTIAYTDAVIARAIDVLSAQSDRLNTSLLYVSDHGESLGEHNLYLHGMPRALAPDEQVHVPMIAWFGDEDTRHLTTMCRDQVDDLPISHDNLFHTELGILRIESSIYQPDLDVFAACRDSSQQLAQSFSASQNRERDHADR